MSRAYLAPDHLHLPPPPETSGWGEGRLAVVTPVHTAELNDDEQLSLESLRRRAPSPHLILLAPEGLELRFDLSGFTVRRLPSACFDGIAAYNALMLQAWFWRLLTGWRRVLIFQTDCLLLRRDLAGWAESGWSYVGAPWLDKQGRPKAVGNGGFSLRSPADHLAVLASERVRLWPMPAPSRRQFAKAKHLGGLLKLLRDTRRPDGRPLGERVAGVFTRPEDEFWSFYAPLLHPGFRIPDAASAVSFAAESRPRHVAALNGGVTPAGGHAWARMDREWWLERLAEADAQAGT